VQANTKHLLRLWGAALFICCIVGGVLIVGLIAALRRGDYIPVVAVSVGLAFAATTILRARRKNRLLFKDSTPDRAIAFYHSSMKRMPNGKAMAAYMSAYAAVLYGRFDQAREELASVNWTSQPQMYQGFETYIHSLLAIFEASDYDRALGLANEARDLCDVSEKFPGARSSRAALEANVAICEMLTGKSDAALLYRLDTASKQLSGVAAAIPAWALAVHHTKAGHQAIAEQYLAVVNRLLPDDTPLRNLAAGTKVAAARNL